MPCYQDWDCVSSTSVFYFQMNDLIRDKFTTDDNSIVLPAEILAGGCVSITLGIFFLFCLQMNPKPSKGTLKDVQNIHDFK